MQATCKEAWNEAMDIIAREDNNKNILTERKRIQKISVMVTI
jgi:hypothetical protein